jgi:hypothetical protein
MRLSLSSVFFASALMYSGSALSIDSPFDPLTYISDDVIVRDVVIIGGGSAGTQAAISLKDKGKSIIVIEKKARLGGHTETYTDPATGIPQDYGVVVYHNISTVQNYFKRFNIPMAASSIDTPRRLDYDLQTGKKLNITHPGPEAIGAALGKYAAFLDQYPQLDKGMYLPSPVPEDLLLPFGKFATKHGVEDLVHTFYNTNQGIGDLLTVSVLENLRVSGLDLVKQLASDGLISTARHNNSEIYGKAQAELLAAKSLLLSSEVRHSSRTGHGVELIVQTPQGIKCIRAKKLLITIPPRTKFLRPFDLSHKEREIFSKLIDTGYYVALIKNTGLPDDLAIWNYAQGTPYNLAAFPGLYSILPSAIPGIKSVYYGSQRSDRTYPVSDVTVKAEMIAALKRLQVVNPTDFNKTEPEIVIYSSHAPFYLQAKPEDTRLGFYERLNALQGQRSTYWSGATFRAHDSSMLWRFNEEEVLPKLLAGL